MTKTRPLRIAFVVLGLLAILLGAAAVYVGKLLYGSRAQLQGEVPATQLSAPSTIARDANGVVSISANTRQDIAFSLGFVHAQERFFQMDLLRRNSAGELSELFGRAALKFDKKIRQHQFRKRASAAVENLPTAHRKLLQAYVQGVNKGLNTLQNKPFEYYLLRAQPQAWRVEDTFLAVYSMYMDLQDEFAKSELAFSAMQATLPQDWVNFLSPLGGEWDAPIQGEPLHFAAPIPQQALASFALEASAQAAGYRENTIDIGSNNWAVGGAVTAHGAALVADDMHLGLNVPNIWFRASWTLPADGRRITGVTLPGAPVMIVGSTEKIAWGFTNAYGDFLDVIRLKSDAEQQRYRSAEGWQPFKRQQEIIKVKSEKAETITVKLSQWGPVINEDEAGNALALRWVAHEPAAANMQLIEFEQAESVNEAVAIAATTGIPAQNLVVGDTQGNIAWTVIGYLPKRFGFRSLSEQKLITDWSQGDRGWQGKLEAEFYPKVINPPNHRLWSANARMVGGNLLQVIGDDFSALGARQQQIRGALLSSETFDESAFLSIHLDDRALFLQRWYNVLNELINRPALAQMPELEPLRLALQTWQGRAATDSAAYLLVKRFRQAVIAGSVGRVLDYVAAQSDLFTKSRVDQKIEYAAWTLINQQPERHLPPGFANWEAFLQNCVLNIADSSGQYATWGEVNQVSIQHPMSRALPILGRWLDMKTVALPGDTYMPRVQGRRTGASQRMAVSPGREASGYFHMPVGQSGHPLSPFFGKGHRDWQQGKASPFLPGATEYTLYLKP